MNLKDHIRVVPNFPKDGINFYDIATLLKNPAAWRETVALLQRKAEDYQPDLLMGIEARGFLVAAPLALEMVVGLEWCARRASCRA
jgi:adenine phosphoribosyltransferase